MSTKMACLNAKSLRDWLKTARLLRDLLSFGVDVAAIEETHFVKLMLGCSLVTLTSIQHTGTSRPKVFPY